MMSPLSLGTVAERSTPGPGSPVCSFRVLATALVGTLATALVCATAPPPAQVTAVGVLLSIVLGLLLAHLQQEAETARQQTELLEALRVPIRLASEHGFFEQYTAIASALPDVARQQDPVLRE